MSRALLWITGGILSVLLFFPLPASSETGNQEDSDRNSTLIFSRVSDRPKKHYKRLKPLIDYVIPRMNDVGITRGKVVFARDNRQLVTYLQEGKVDWVTDTPFSILFYQEKTGGEILLRRWKSGVPKYHSIIIALQNTQIDSLHDLKGKTIAFEDPGSTSAYFLPVAELKMAGLELQKLENNTDRPPPNKVGYVFGGGELNVSAWVEKGKGGGRCFKQSGLGRFGRRSGKLEKEIQNHP